MKQKDNLEKQFYRIRISEDDFREALEYLKEYDKYNFNIPESVSLRRLQASR